MHLGIFQLFFVYLAFPVKNSRKILNASKIFILVYFLPRNSCRKDLANIVRRRGYKAITKLLLSSNANDSEYSDENHERNNSAEDKNSGL